MIFLTVGGQLPFDRLVNAMDEIAPFLDEEVFGQIGKTESTPKNFHAVNFLSPVEFQERFLSARVIVGHSGIGTILTGIQLEKPLVLMARRAALGEHRNDHQLATVEQLCKVQGVTIVEDASELRSALVSPHLLHPEPASSESRVGLIGYLRREIAEIQDGKGRAKSDV